MDAYIGQIILWAGAEYVPAGWLSCDGQLLNTREYQALFSIIGNKFGGDGQRNFALPDLRGRTPIGTGKGPETFHEMGATGGDETVQLSISQVPSHSHAAKLPDNAKAVLPDITANMPVSKNAADKQVPGPNAVPAALPDAGGLFDTNASIYSEPDGNTFIPVLITAQSRDIVVDLSKASATISDTGGNQAHNNMQPFLALQYIICIQGEYPPHPDNKDTKTTSVNITIHTH